MQLLTIHGAKGLEWDAVAVVRLVEDELPTRSRDAKGWLRFGILPYEYRGDAPWLPTLAWNRDAAPTQQDLKVAFEEFTAAGRAREIDEERRLAYVAVTRARDRLLLSGSSWSGTKSPREPSRFLLEMAEALGKVIDTGDAGENPYLDDRRILTWPIDPLGGRRGRVGAAADAVTRALAAPRPNADADLALLLAERDERSRPADTAAPIRIPASRFHEYVTGSGGVSRPMPERPYRETRLGTLFHAWVEQRSGRVGSAASADDTLWGVDGTLDVDDTDDGGADAATLERLKTAFLASEWADRRPSEVEVEIDFVDDSLDGRPHLVICKLDAVYERDGRVEIVDWKTGAPPATAADKTSRMLQLELYRRAYHAARGVPVAEIDVTLFYVAHGVIVRG